jgi:hypothetical protein
VSLSGGAVTPHLPLGLTRRTSCTSEHLRHDVIIVVDAAGGLHSSYTIRAVLRETSENGTTYIGIGVNNGAEYFSADETPANGTFGDRFRLISQDGSPNMLVHAIFHITVDPSGRITRFWNELDIVCR